MMLHYVKRPTTISPLLPASLYTFRKKKGKKTEKFYCKRIFRHEFCSTRANLEGENRTDRFLEIFRSTLQGHN